MTTMNNYLAAGVCILALLTLGLVVLPTIHAWLVMVAIVAVILAVKGVRALIGQ